ncbi:MAG: hypothetical protein ACKVWR_14880 [Acidimicrobiales bacterium]
MELEKRGTPTVTLATDAFVRLAALQSKAMGHPDLAVVVIDHPLGGIPHDEVLVKAKAAAAAVVERLGPKL